VQKLFHKRKLAVGLIKFRYNYYLYENFILYERFEASIKNSNAWYFDKQPKFFTKRDIYAINYFEVAAVVSVVLLILLLPDQICNLVKFIAMVDTTLLDNPSHLLTVLITLFDINILCLLFG
jgi:hypothetical protein|tara:strand:- start:889 stop:1254 length:366 start_codon:yes stop_codon:yes gene_type:complete